MRRLPEFLIASTVSLVVSVSSANAQSGELGIHDLVKRLGSTAPTGAGVVVAQVEVADSPGNYGPNPSDPEFIGKTFTAQSGPSGITGHATLVGQNFYGSTLGMASGITTIRLYELLNWLQTGYLRFGQGSGNPPLFPVGGAKVYNHSWVASSSVATVNEVLRRADFTVTRDQITHITGVQNGLPQEPLLCHMYNSISVGLSSGAHTFGNTLASYDGPGRQKPEIVGPSQETSFAAPYIGAIVARLVETANLPPLSSNVSALRADVLKAVLLAGAAKRAGWSNNPATSGASRGVTATPIDPIYGVDVANANNSHLILTGLEQNGADSPPAAPNVIRRGWDFATVNANASKYYRFRITTVADEVKVLATWNRIVNNDLVSWSVANFNLTLHRIGAGGSLTTLVGSAGLPYFATGNVVSQSAVDNVEHLYITNLQPGDYTIQLQRVDALGGTREVAIAWLLPKKPGDVNEDGTTGVPDLLQLLNTWGPCPAPCIPFCPADLTEDCNVGVPDLLFLISNWG